MTDWLPASVVGEEHVGWWVQTQPMTVAARLVAVVHGGPFTVPQELLDAGWLPPWLDLPGGNLPRAFTTQLLVQPVSPGFGPGGPPTLPPYYVWLVPQAQVYLTHPDHPAQESLP